MMANRSLFESMGIRYDEFRLLPMEEKMRHIRVYARHGCKRAVVVVGRYAGYGAHRLFRLVCTLV